jgi:hypothetical protein
MTDKENKVPDDGGQDEPERNDHMRCVATVEGHNYQQYLSELVRRRIRRKGMILKKLQYM